MLEYVQYMDPVTSKGTSNTVLDEMQNIPVVWDDQLLHRFVCKDALEHEETQFDKCLDVDNNTKVDVCVRDLLTYSSDMGSTDQVCNGLPGKVVVWDELFHDPHDGLLQSFDAEMDNPMECKHAMFKASIMSNRDVPEVFDAFPQGVGSQDSLLELLAHGECLISMDNKEITEPVSFKAPVAGELFDENPVWDDDPKYDTKPPDDMSLVVDHVVEPLTKDFQVLSRVRCSYLDLKETHAEGIIKQLASNSKGTENTTVHSGSLQQLAWGREAFDSEMRQPELVYAGLLTNVCSSTVSIHSDLQLSNQGCKLEFFVDAYLMDSNNLRGTMASEQQQPEMYMMLKRQWNPGILEWLRNIFKLQYWNGEDLNEQGTVSVNAIVDVWVVGQELNSGSVTLVIDEGWQGAMVSKYICFIDTYPMYKNTCMYWRTGIWYYGDWRDACWLTEQILPGISHATVSILASEKTDNMLFHVGDFHPRESEQLELCMTTLIQWDLGLACQMVLAATKWWHENFGPWKSNLDQPHSEKMSLSTINVFNPAGMQQYVRITNSAFVSLLKSRRIREFQDALEQAGAQMTIDQFVAAKRETMGCSLHPRSAGGLILGEGHIRLQLPGSTVCSNHQTFAGMPCQMSDYWVLHTVLRKGMPLLQCLCCRRNVQLYLYPRYLRKYIIRTLYGMSNYHGSLVSAISNI